METQDEGVQTNLPEAAASASTKIKSPNGFEYIFTMRDAKSSNLLFKMKKMEEHFMNSGFTAVAQNSKYPAKEKEYVQGRTCPQCGSRLVYTTKKDGTKYIRCETNKWNAQLRRAEGCTFVEWPNKQYSASPYNSSSYDDYAA